MRITKTTAREFPLFDDFREVLRVLEMPEGESFVVDHPDGSIIEFSPDEWNWFLKAAEKGWKLL